VNNDDINFKRLFDKWLYYQHFLIQSNQFESSFLSVHLTRSRLDLVWTTLEPFKRGKQVLQKGRVGTKAGVASSDSTRSGPQHPSFDRQMTSARQTILLRLLYIVSIIYKGEITHMLD